MLFWVTNDIFWMTNINYLLFLPVLPQPLIPLVHSLVVKKKCDHMLSVRGCPDDFEFSVNPCSPNYLVILNFNFPFLLYVMKYIIWVTDRMFLFTSSISQIWWSYIRAWGTRVACKHELGKKRGTCPGWCPWTTCHWTSLYKS